MGAVGQRALAMLSSMTEASVTRRPGIVTFVVVLSYLAGLADIVLGILIIFARYIPDIVSAGYGVRLLVTLVGAATVLFGLLTIALASGISRGSRFSRWGVTGLLSAGFILTLILHFANADQDLSGVIIQAVICIVAILPLWVGRSRQYFRSA
jgi:holin-like protein